jgi:putative transposase
VALGRPIPPLVLSEDEVQQLQALASSRSLPHSIVQRVQIVLACGAGETNTSIANRMGLTGMTVGKWRKRYREQGLEGLHDELRPGRPRTYEDDTVAEVINRALQTRPPDGSTQWSARSLAAATGISKTTVHRWLQTFSVQPHRQKHYRSAEA